VYECSLVLAALAVLLLALCEPVWHRGWSQASAHPHAVRGLVEAGSAVLLVLALSGNLFIAAGKILGSALAGLILVVALWTVALGVTLRLGSDRSAL
jgi:hypothetical protein